MGLLPPLLVALFAAWCGTFAGAATFAGATFGQLVILAAAIGAPAWRDPLGLGRAGRVLPWALLVATAASVAASPVPRAGRVGLTLLPAFLLLPAFVARCWSTPERRRTGLAGMALVAGGIGVWALVELASRGGGPARAAMPLGHHNLLAAFLVIVLPIAAVGLERPGAPRLLAFLGVAPAVAALALTRSFLHLGILAVIALASAWRIPRARDLFAGLSLLGLALLVPRAEAIARGTDSSASARAVYARGAWEGIRERPVLGWGPGSTPWTLAETSHPRPGVNPPGEIVGEAHSLPLELARELGITGIVPLVALLFVFGLRRWRPRESADDPALLVAGLVAAGAGLLSGLGGAWLAVTAIPVALAVAFGAALAGDGAPTRGEPRPRGGAGWSYFVVAAVALAPIAIAHRAYDLATRVPRRAEAVPLLDRAVRFDPSFPLYAARRAWAADDAPAERARAALDAARAAGGLAPLWLRGGLLALEAGDRELARGAFARAMALDPLSAFAPFQLAPLADDPAACAARAFAAEPRLLASTLFRDRRAALDAAVARLAAYPPLEPGWRQAFAREASRLEPATGDDVDLVAAIDGDPALAFSLHAFRRRPWPADLARLPVERAGVMRLRGLPSAATMTSSPPAAFPADRCLE